MKTDKEWIDAIWCDPTMPSLVDGGEVNDDTLAFIIRAVQADAIEACAQVPAGILLAMPAGTIFPVTKGIVTRIVDAIRKLKPRGTP